MNENNKKDNFLRLKRKKTEIFKSQEAGLRRRLVYGNNKNNIFKRHFIFSLFSFNSFLL